MKALITGGTSGIGSGVARQLADCGWDLIIVGRNSEGGKQIAADINGQFIQADLSLMAEVERLAGQITEPLDALILCAGSLSMQSDIVRTNEGIEQTFATNYLSRFVLSQMLLPQMNHDAVIVMVNGNGKYRGVTTDWETEERGFKAAFKAALAVDLYASQLANHAKDLRVHTCYPGWVRTNLFRDMILPLRLLMGVFGTKLEKGSSYVTRLVLEKHQAVHWMQDTELQFQLPLPGDDVAEALRAYSEQLISERLTNKASLKEAGYALQS